MAAKWYEVMYGYGQLVWLGGQIYGRVSCLFLAVLFPSHNHVLSPVNPDNKLEVSLM